MVPSGSVLWLGSARFGPAMRLGPSRRGIAAARSAAGHSIMHIMPDAHAEVPTMSAELMRGAIFNNPASTFGISQAFPCSSRCSTHDTLAASFDLRPQSKHGKVKRGAYLGRQGAHGLQEPPLVALRTLRFAAAGALPRRAAGGGPDPPPRRRDLPGLPPVGCPCPGWSAPRAAPSASSTSQTCRAVSPAAQQCARCTVICSERASHQSSYCQPGDRYKEGGK